ncbi:hypothetical protein KR044_011406, partial [Drosophila immigrans]
MPAEIVISKHKQTQEQQLQRELQAEQQQNCHINLCATLPSSGVDANANANDNANAIAERNTSNAVAADDVAAATTAWRRRKSSAKAASTLRTVIIIMALVFSIKQQQQQQQQEQQRWLFYNELHNTNSSNGNGNSDYYKNKSMSLRQAEDFSGDDVPTLSTSASDRASVAATLPQTDATNHTFKSLAFLANTNANNALDASYSPSPHSLSDGFAVASQETDADLVHSLPIFDFGMPRNITGRTGHTEAIIKCRVDSLHDKSVSWIRKRDLHILTVGTATYTSDKRFQACSSFLYAVTESKDAREWTLHVKSPLAKDSGIYECQVNTEPKMSMAFQLNIIEISPDAKAIISGPHDLHFKAGSAIIIHCVVKQPSVKDIGPIYWYRGEHMITPFDSDVSDADNLIKEQSTDQTVEQSLNEVLSTELAKDFTTRIAMESQLGDTLKSKLRISNAQTSDTGNYTCQPTTASSASVMVHVIN